MKKIIIVLFIFIYVEGFTQWIKVSNGLPSTPNGWSITSMVIDSSRTDLFAVSYNIGVYRSINNGGNWSSVWLTNKSIQCIFSKGNNLFLGTYQDSPNGVYRSTNNGVNWSSCGFWRVMSFTTNGSDIFAGSLGGGVSISYNDGVNWVNINNGLTNKYVWSVYYNGSNLFASTDSGVFRSSNNGGSWSAKSSGLSNLSVRSLASIGNNMFAGTWNGIYLSTNNGDNWTAGWFTSQGVYPIISSGNNLFISSGGIYFTSNNGSSWYIKNQGFQTMPIVRSFLIANNYIFFGTADTQSIWRRSLSEIIGVENISTEIPSKFSLFQNNPNPFNPNTNIKFQIKNAGFVNLKVFDILGKEIETLVNEKLKEGTYEVSFDGSQVPSGIYFYKLTSDNFSDTKRMILIK